MIWQLLCAGIFGYLLGSINGAVIVSWFYKTDVRKMGSKNAGATNTMRTLGKKAAIMVVIIDLLKGLAAVFAATYLLPNEQNAAAAAGFFAIIGHSFPIYFGFRGGKGVLTSAAVIFALNWQLGLILLPLALIVMAVSGYVSVGSCTAAAAFPVLAAVFGCDAYFIGFSAAIGVFVIFMHRSNIKRLLAGTENRLKL